MKSLKIIFGSSVLLLCCLVNSAFACGCPTVGDGSTDFNKRLVKEKFTNAEVIFSGKVVEKTQFEVKFKIDSVWKGQVGDEFTMSTGTVDNGDGSASSTSCDYHFEAKKSYLVYATQMELERSRGQRLLVASGCGVAFSLQKAVEEIIFLNEIITPEQRNDKEPKK